MPLLGILGGFESLQKQCFHIFGANEKIGKKFEILGKIAFFREKNRVSSEKLAIFLRIFYFRFFLPKIVSNPTENDFWPKNRPKKKRFFLSLCVSQHSKKALGSWFSNHFGIFYFLFFCLSLRQNSQYIITTEKL